MNHFDRISIQEISKEDMLLIIEALEYTGLNTNIKAYIDLRDNMVEELSSLAETTEEKFLAFLNKSIQ